MKARVMYRFTDNGTTIEVLVVGDFNDKFVDKFGLGYIDNRARAILRSSVTDGLQLLSIKPVNKIKEK